MPIPRPAMSVGNALDPQRSSDSFTSSWEMVKYTQTNVQDSINLTLVMEYICEKVIDFMTENQSTTTEIHNVSVSIKASKDFYMETDPTKVTRATISMDGLTQQSYENLMKVLQGLQKRKRRANIYINLDPILQRIHYSQETSTRSIECLIKAVETLNQTATHCCIL